MGTGLQGSRLEMDEMEKERMGHRGSTIRVGLGGDGTRLGGQDLRWDIVQLLES